MKKFWRNFKLRMTLFRIWFVKNILVWIQIFCIVSLILIFAGIINENTPFFGKVVYPIFAPLADNIHEIIQEKGVDDLTNFISIIISILASVGIFTMRVRSIAINDIKSKKLKVALIKANLYFNEDGKLTKRIEKMTNKDLDCDGKVGNTEVENEGQVNYGVINGIVTAAKELGVIMTADLSGNDEEVNAEVDRVIDETDSRGTKEVLDDKDAFEKNLEADTAAILVDEKIEEIQNDNALTEEEKEQSISIFKRIKNFFARKKVERVDDGLGDEEPEQETEILTDEIEDEEPTSDTVVEPQEVVVNTTRTVTTNTTTNNSTKTANDFLNQLRNRR